jgi:xylulokinase
VAIYLGLDSSTQSLTATAIEVEGSHRSVLFERTLVFDTALPHYGTRHGVLPGTDPLVAFAPPLMWAEALDRMMADIAASGIDRSRVRAISGSAQQHGSVYLADGAGDRLAQLDPRLPLIDQLSGCFARDVSPIWMDSSTAAECSVITETVGGPAALARLTGSRAFERFTGPQIRKFSIADPPAYARTERIHLVSSFLASLLAGRHAPIEPGDGSGMNLMDLGAKRWAPAAISATAADLDSKLPELRESWSLAGPLAPYWTRRYGFPQAGIVAWSGDNPCSLIGVGLVREGRMAISLGTSDTVFGYMSEPRVDPSGTGHVFGAPTGDYMGLSCFRNGSLARERIRDEYGLSWDGFSAALRETPAGNGGAIMLPWVEPEITPPVREGGVRRYGLDPGDVRANVRAVVEGQMMAMALHSRWMNIAVDTIHATGGAAVNREILTVMADVFGADVYRIQAGNSAALGAALRAYHADMMSSRTPITWDQVVAEFAVPRQDSRVAPTRSHVSAYARLMDVYRTCEGHALRGEGDPATAIAAFRSQFSALR